MNNLKRLASLGIFLGSLGFATNGDFLIGVGPVSRSMGGIGIGLPTDADSIVFSNPALMTYYKKSVVAFGGTLFMPHTKGYVGNATQTASATSNAKYFAIPSIAIVYPLSQKWVFGIAAYGISGMGVDYRNTNVKCDPNSPGCYTNFQGMEVSPSLAYKVNEKLSLGFGLDLIYGALDLGAGLSSDYAVAAQLGVAYKINKKVNIGASIKTPYKLNFARVGQFDTDPDLDGLTLEQPWVYGVGVGLQPTPKLKLGVDLQYITWSKSDGYKDFGWNDQWVFKIGGAYRINDKLTFRLGYNYGKNPIKGRTVPATPQAEGRECLRIIGFPAIVEHHISLGLGIKLNPSLNLDLAYMHAFKNTVTSYATDGTYWKSKLSEDSISVGLTWSF